MATATLTFNLDDPDDVQAFEACTQAKNVLLWLWDVQQMMRTMVKYDSLPSVLNGTHFSYYQGSYPGLNSSTPVSSLTGDVAIDLFRDAFFTSAENEKIDLGVFG